jgi:hypothetical protein
MKNNHNGHIASCLLSQAAHRRCARWFFEMGQTIFAFYTSLYRTPMQLDPNQQENWLCDLRNLTKVKTFSLQRLPSKDGTHL